MITHEIATKADNLVPIIDANQTKKEKNIHKITDLFPSIQKQTFVKNASKAFLLREEPLA